MVDGGQNLLFEDLGDGVCWRNSDYTGLHEYPDVDFPRDDSSGLQLKICKFADELEPDELKDLLGAMPDDEKVD